MWYIEKNSSRIATALVAMYRVESYIDPWSRERPLGRSKRASRCSNRNKTCHIPQNIKTSERILNIPKTAKTNI
jgi:hypothetical protein